MQQVLDKARVPPGGLFRYIDPETKVEFSHPYFMQVKTKAKQHRLANHLPIPLNWEEWLEDQICQATPSCPCEPAGDVKQKSLWNLATRFTRAMANWAASGFKLVSDEVLAQRRLACEGDEFHARCPQWEAHTGYFGMGRCGKCGCAGGLKSAIATEVCPLNRWPA